MDYFTFWYKNDENAFHTQTGSYILSNASKNLHETRKSLPYIKQHPPPSSTYKNSCDHIYTLKLLHSFYNFGHELYRLSFGLVKRSKGLCNS